ncbi:hypothetical protein SEA_BING_75 [Streptomyces phage Bing]|uniref:Uncharacterized protein n=1 Tax=Streptomyces phage Bing TaxID=2079427 RepID=A0A2L1IWD5_9CAUD|nr:hypothetical protein FDJ31_gp75 [Streptomyces phage Bing]AVD99497.1 hypothetical protein SEA_BING_75 [Streptomyces phage Bing]
MDATPSVFWRRSYRVQAVRITKDNILEIAEHLGLDYSEEPNQFGEDKTTPVPHITSVRKGYGFIGDWVVVYSNDDFKFFPDKEFAERFRTHSEQLAADEKYAKVFQIVVAALQIQAQASFHGDTDGMDLVAIETTKKLLEEL